MLPFRKDRLKHRQRPRGSSVIETAATQWHPEGPSTVPRIESDEDGYTS